jgi:hypothetical protein
MTNDLVTLKKTAAEHLRAAHHATDEARTSALRATAEALVDAREHFYTADGSSDWTGRSYAYRRFVGDVYTDAAVPREDLATLQAAIRYHVGNALRERLSPEDLDALGLRTVGPRERSVEKRSRQSALLAQMGGEPIETPEDALDALHTVDRILSRINASALKDLPADGRRDARSTLTEAEDLLDALLTAAGRRRKEPATNGK